MWHYNAGPLLILRPTLLCQYPKYLTCCVVENCTGSDRLHTGNKTTLISGSPPTSYEIPIVYVPCMQCMHHDLEIFLFEQRTMYCACTDQSKLQLWGNSGSEIVIWIKLVDLQLLSTCRLRDYWEESLTRKIPVCTSWSGLLWWQSCS